MKSTSIPHLAPFAPKHTSISHHSHVSFTWQQHVGGQALDQSCGRSTWAAGIRLPLRALHDSSELNTWLCMTETATAHIIQRGTIEKTVTLNILVFPKRPLPLTHIPGCPKTILWTEQCHKILSHSTIPLPPAYTYPTAP